MPVGESLSLGQSGWRCNQVSGALPQTTSLHTVPQHVGVTAAREEGIHFALGWSLYHWLPSFTMRSTSLKFSLHLVLHFLL